MADEVGNGATLQGGTGWSAAHPNFAGGGSLSLNGSDAYLDLTLAACKRPTSTGQRGRRPSAGIPSPRANPPVARNTHSLR